MDDTKNIEMLLKLLCLQNQNMFTMVGTIAGFVAPDEPGVNEFLKTTKSRLAAQGKLTTDTLAFISSKSDQDRRSASARLSKEMEAELKKSWKN